MQSEYASCIGRPIHAYRSTSDSGRPPLAISTRCGEYVCIYRHGSVNSACETTKLSYVVSFRYGR